MINYEPLQNKLNELMELVEDKILAGSSQKVEKRRQKDWHD